MKRIIAFVLSVIMLISVIPAQQLFAADSSDHYFELDIDGIDAGAQYLIVSEKKDGEAYALQNGNTSAKSVEISNHKINSFDGDSSCVWTFGGVENGTITNGDYYLDIGSKLNVQTSESILNYADLGLGTYGIYLKDATTQYLYYLRYDNTEGWKVEQNINTNADANNLSSYISCVYLFKKITMHSVSYDANEEALGTTDGTIPGITSNLKTGTAYTVLAPSDDFRVIDDEGLIYIFVGWNTEADATGETYLPGDTLTIGYEDVTLYAKWQVQMQHTITVLTTLNNQATDMNLIDNDVEGVYVSLDSTPTNNPQYIELTRTDTGSYATTVNKNGNYYVYFKYSGEIYEQVHGHQVVIYNQSGSTTLQHYSVTYDTGVADEQEGTVGWQENHHANTRPMVTSKIPKKSGYVFTGWADANGNVLTQGTAITEALKEPVVLTAQWKVATKVTVKLTINHAYEQADGTLGEDNASDKSDVSFQLLQWREENDVNRPLENGLVTLTAESDGYTYANDVTEYTYVFDDMEQGTDINYHISTAKSGYEIKNMKTTYLGSNEGYLIEVSYQYAPSNFDLVFDVRMAQDTPTSLYPQAVNVKVSYWGYNRDNKLGWHIITQQDGDEAPTTVYINQTTGEGSGFYPVWKYWSGIEKAYDYRIEVTSYVLPDGRIVAATSTDKILYTSSMTGLYSGVVTIEPNGEGGRVPTYPDNSNTNLPGAYYSDSTQKGVPTVTITTHPYMVTFNAGEYGTVNGETMLTLGGQYQYPNLDEYIPVATDEAYIFDGWYIKDMLASNQTGSYLTENVSYTAKWKQPREVYVYVVAEATYYLNNKIVNINERDRAKEVVVILQKLVNNVYVSITSQELTYEYHGRSGHAEYTFYVPDDGSEYRIEILELNYSSVYDNNSDHIYTSEENKVVFYGDSGQVEARLSFTPESYDQVNYVDARQISKDYRPTGVLAKIDYRILGMTESEYLAISQHNVEPFGTQMVLDANGEAYADYSLWKWHTEGALYEYQLDLTKLYGTVSGVFDAEGNIAYDSVNSPYTIRYGQTSWWNEEAEGASALQATLIPKTYEIKFDLNLGNDTNAEVFGMDEYVTDDGNNGYYYSHEHIWSYGDNLTAFPYRVGYVFQGWTVKNQTEGVYINSDGYITVGAGVAQDVTLVAQWKELTGTCYTVRYLEKNTERVLRGAKVVEGASEGTTIMAHDEVSKIIGYEYVGASINGTYHDWTEGIGMELNAGTSNLMTIYYVPSDDGYTEPVESNLHLDKTATLENDGTYTITMETYTKDNPVTTQILQNTPLDVVLVIDQSGSIVQDGYLDELQESVHNFITLVAEHGRTNEVDHRIAMVGYAGDATTRPTSTDTTAYPLAGGNTTNWVNTGVFDSNGDFHPYTVKGFNYEPYSGRVEANGTYYTLSDGKYLLLMYHEEYYHLITEEQAKTEALNDQTVYGYVDGEFKVVNRNHSGLWIYGENQLYSLEEFFTRHQDVWTHRDGLGQRMIHAYGTGDEYQSIDGHSGLYTRTETTSITPELDVYKDALVPVSIEQNGAGRTNPHLTDASNKLGSNGGTFVQYGIEMANKIFAANEDTSSGRVRVMVMFTDGSPGATEFSQTEANAAIQKAYDTKNTHKAYCYTIGLYAKTEVSPTSDVSVYMNAVSSNYPNAKKMSDVYTAGSYYTASRGTKLNDGKTYYVRVRDNWSYIYLPLTYGTIESRYGWEQTGWYYQNGDSYNLLTTTLDAAVGSNGKINGTTIYRSSGGYASTAYSGYYSTTDSEAKLKEYFENVMTEITTKITREIILHTDTIIRDIMGQGLVLTDRTQIKAYKQEGIYNFGTGGIDWAVDASGNPRLEDVATLAVATETQSSQKVPINGKEVSYIQVYNKDSKNPTNPKADDYQPHTVDITGYDFKDWYISDTHPQGYKMVVTISNVEARDDVVWGRSTETNNEQSGLWLPADAQGNRELLLAFDQPKTIFVQRAYVLDYAKTFNLAGWYFDKNNDNAKVGPIHIDTNIEDGMNWFDGTQPCINSGNELKYANASIQNQVVSYTPTNMNWDDVQAFYIFGNTDNTTVTTQNANQNGNLWTKVEVLPANNIYYEDSFVTTESSGVDGVKYSGFTYTGEWKTVSEDKANLNDEKPEHQEDSEYGDVHGWIDSMRDDTNYSDGSAHYVEGEAGMGASVEFTFTGVGVDVYTTTNARSGMVVAMLYQIVDGKEVLKDGIIRDNLTVSGEYYHIPTISFKGLTYGTYKVQIIATQAYDADTGTARYEYYLDGIRVYSPLGENQVNASDIIKDAYEQEQNAVFTEVRDVLLDYQSFHADTSETGAVFIDTIKEGQGTGADQVGNKNSTYEIGTFEEYGPKNEVYLKGGQSIILKVDSTNTYYVGLKSLTGAPVSVNVSGISKATPTMIEVTHSIDMYYQVTPVEGYIVIENASSGEEILSITKLRTTNLSKAVTDGGILPVTQQEAVMMMARFALRMNPPVYEEPEVDQPEEQVPETEGATQGGSVLETPDVEPLPNKSTTIQETTDKNSNAVQSVQQVVVNEKTEETVVSKEDTAVKEPEESKEDAEVQEVEKTEKLSIWQKILRFFERLFDYIGTWLSNKIGGENS